VIPHPDARTGLLPSTVNYDLHGRVYLVTGASRRVGIGAAVARRLASAGADLVLHSWTPYDARQPWGADAGIVDRLRDECESLGSRVLPVSADFADPSAPAHVLAAAVDAFGHVDGIVVNHARGIGATIDEVTAEEIDLSFAVNARSAALLVQALAAQHDGRAGGRAILFTSGQHRGGMPGELPYVISKGAVQQMTATLAAELAPRGIIVNCVNPGPTDTGWAGPDDERIVRERMPQGRWGQPDDVARLITWLLSDDGAWITGQTIDSEGGFRR
jgi:3-oxoacyl-[acyl-carrier protein] reductase